MAKDKYLHRTKFLDLIDRDGWTFVRRPKLAGVVGIVAVTPAGELMLIEQHRPPLGKNVIELPAGLAGDLDAGESLAAAAKRELLEETGYRASRVKKLAEG
ncbi:MAG TPA: NUDIX hydrolase, partial [Tepidisphaeraceae bacterium]